MSIEARTLRRFTVREYHAMAQAGILSSDDRVELVDGRIVTMAAIGPRHAWAVDRLTKWLVTKLADRAIVRVQNPVTLDDFSEPEPDLAVLRPGNYRDAHPGPQDVLLLIEVADSSGGRDRRAKMPRYAAAGIGEVWFFDLVAGRLEVHREPQGTRFAMVRIVGGPDERVAPAAFPDVTIDPSEILA